MPAENSLPELINQDELMRLLRLSRTSLFRLRQAGVLPPAIKIGKSHIRWRRDVIETWLKEREEKMPT